MMKGKTKEQLITELEKLRQRINELETPKNKRRQAGEKIKLENEEWETTFNSITDLVSIQDKNFKIVRVNKAYADALEVKPEKLIGKYCYEVIHGTNEPWLNCPHKKTIETKKSVTEEFSEPRLGMYLEVSTSPILNEKDEVIGTIHIAKDITTRKRTEEELKKQTYDLGERVKELDCLYSISKLVEIPGISLKEIFQGTVDLIPSAMQYPDITCTRIIMGNQVYQTNNFKETRLKQTNKFVLYSDQVGTLEVFYTEKKPEMGEEPFLKEERSLIEAIAERLGRVTERIQAQELLKRSEERYTLAQRVAHIGSWDWDTRTGDLIWSDQIEPMFGFNRGEFGATYESFLDCVHPEDRQHVIDSVNACIEEGKDYAIEHRIVWPNGTVHWVSETGNVIRDEKRKAIRMLGIVQNITDRKMAEAALQKAHNELEQRVEERTAELKRLNEQLKQEIKERKRVGEQISRQSTILKAINKVLQETLKCETDEEVASTCLAVAEDLTSSKFGFIGELNPSSGLFDAIAISNPGWDACKMPDSEAAKVIKNMPLRGIDRSVLRDKKSRIVNDPASHPDRIGPPKGHPLLISFLGIPLRYAGNVFGMIGLGNKESGYDINDQDAVEVLSVAFVEALLRKRAERILWESEKQLQSLSSQLLTFQEKERKRVAQELHDSVGQILAALKYRVESVINEVGREAVEKYAQSLKDIIPKIQDAVEEVDRIGKGLRPLILDDLGIIATFSWFCREFEETYPGIQIEKEIILDEDEIPESLKLTMYRILQESLNNIAKHSKADIVRISLNKIDRAIELTIKDNGRGFDLESTLSPESDKGGLGFISMIKRTELSGGSLVIKSDKETGTTLKAVWTCKECL